jgi:hypothetical protein
MVPGSLRRPILILLAFVSVSSLAAQDLRSRPGDFVYRPLSNEGYMQAWNFNFRGSGYYVYITYIISNFGPGDRNNGMSMLIYNRGKSIVRTAEYTERSLKATPGKFGLRAGLSWIRFKDGKYEAYAERDDVRVRVDLTPRSGGVRLSGGPIKIGGGSFIRADVPVGYGTVTGALRIGDKRVEIKGVGGIEYLYANNSPHTYAKRFILHRTYSGGRGLFLGGFHGTDKFPGGRLFRAILTDGGRIVAHGKIGKIEQVRSERNAFSGYQIPLQTHYHLEGDSTCHVKVARGSFAGGYHVLGHVSALLRWVVKVLFAKPYIMQYNAKATIECPGAGNSPLKKFAGRSYPLQSSHYMINE